MFCISLLRNSSSAWWCLLEPIQCTASLCCVITLSSTDEFNFASMAFAHSSMDIMPVLHFVIIWPQHLRLFLSCSASTHICSVYRLDCMLLAGLSLLLCRTALAAGFLWLPISPACQLLQKLPHLLPDHQ